MVNRTSNINLYKWDKTDSKQTTIIEMAANMDVIDSSLAESATDIKQRGFNAKHYLATGDGVTDDILFLNNAITDALTTGGKVLLPPGQFYISSDLNIPAKVDIVGSGVGEDTTLAKTVILLGDNASVVVKGRQVSIDNLLITPKNPTTHTKDGLVIGSTTDNASRFKASRIAVNQCGLWGIRLQQSNGYIIEAQCNNNKGKGYGVAPTVDSNVHGGQIRIDVYGNGDDGADLNSCIGVTGSILSQSNHGNGIHISGWGNTISGYVEFNGLTGLNGQGTVNSGKYNVVLDGNASGNDVTLTIFDNNLGNKIWYAKSNLRQNNFIKYTDGDTPTKGGYFATTRLRLDWINDVLASVDSPTGADIMEIRGAEPNGQGLYKYDSGYGWLRLDGVTFRALPGTPNKGLEIHDTGDNRRKYYDGSSWRILSRFVTAPATATSTGSQGDWSTDGSYLYVCFATNSWRRVAVATW
jgi:hypothetical protein